MTFSQDEQNRGPEFLLKGSENPFSYFSMCLPQEAVPEMKANVIHVLALIHPQKKLIKCQHPRRSLFSVFF